MKKFIKTEGERVTLIHYMPFDKENGLGKTPEQLKKEGILVDKIPVKPDVELDEVPKLYYTEEKGLHYRIKKQPK